MVSGYWGGVKYIEKYKCWASRENKHLTWLHSIFPYTTIVLLFVQLNLSIHLFIHLLQCQTTTSWFSNDKAHWCLRISVKDCNILPCLEEKPLKYEGGKTIAWTSKEEAVDAVVAGWGRGLVVQHTVHQFLTLEARDWSLVVSEIVSEAPFCSMNWRNYSLFMILY